MVVWALETSDSTTGARRVFLPQFKRGIAVSGAQNIHKNLLFVRKGATSMLNFGAENLRFRHRMWSNETAVKQRKKTIFEPLREEPQWPKSAETEEKYGLSNLFRLQFSCETRLNLLCFPQRENCSPKTPNSPLFDVNRDVNLDVSRDVRKPTWPLSWLPYLCCWGGRNRSCSDSGVSPLVAMRVAKIIWRGC